MAVAVMLVWNMSANDLIAPSVSRSMSPANGLKKMYPGSSRSEA